jgi:hypothetical protein
LQPSFSKIQQLVVQFQHPWQLVPESMLTSFFKFKLTASVSSPKRSKSSSAGLAGAGAGADPQLENQFVKCSRTLWFQLQRKKQCGATIEQHGQICLRQVQR